MSRLKAMGGVAPAIGLSAKQLASCYADVVRPGETAAEAGIRLKEALVGASLGADKYCAEILWGVEAAIIAAQHRTPPSTLEDAGGILVTSDFEGRLVSDSPEYGSTELIFGLLNSLPANHWCHEVMNREDLLQSADGPCIYIGSAKIIHIQEAVRTTQRVRKIQRTADASYRLAQEQAAVRARLAWEQSPEGQIQALKREIEELKKHIPAMA